MSTTSEPCTEALGWGRRLGRAVAACWLGAIAACAAARPPGPSVSVARPEAPLATAVDSAGVCAPTPTSVAARFAQFAPLGPVARGGVVVRVRGAKHAIELLLRDLEIEGAVTHPCPGRATLVWIPGGTPRTAALFDQQGLEVEETVVLAPSPQP